VTRKRWLILAGVLCALALYLFWNPNGETFLVPAGYVGPVVVAFSHPRGVKRERTIDAYVYRIPSDGILRIKDSQPSGVKMVAWYFVDASGKRTRIPDYWPEMDRHKLTTPHLCCQEAGGGRGAMSFIHAQIGVPADDNGFFPSAYHVVEAVQEEYAKSP
jgi:hypothetical protein